MCMYYTAVHVPGLLRTTVGPMQVRGDIPGADCYTGIACQKAAPVHCRLDISPVEGF